jgi:Fur family zinc uptake transcriptional regulator
MADSSSRVCFPNSGHDHSKCINSVLKAAESYCRDQGLRLTQLRRRVLELVWNSHRPLGAYELLEQLTAQGERRAAPPTVYRSLDFLLEHGLVHRIASLNAFVGCMHPGREHAAQFFICDACGEAAELEDPVVDRAITKDADHLGFRIASQTIEITGTCAQCVRNGE